MKHRPRATRWLALATALALPGAALAQLPNDPDLLRVEVPVPNTSTTAQNRALQQAVQAVLRRVSGNPDPTSLTGWHTIRTNPRRYTAGLEYLQRRISELSLFEKLQTPKYISRRNAQPGAEDQSEPDFTVTLLEVSFDKQALEQVLEEYSWTRWPTSRPRVALWLYASNGFREDLLPNSADGSSRWTEGRARPYWLSLKYIFSLPGIEYSLPTPAWMKRNRVLVEEARRRNYDEVAQHYARNGYSELVVARIHSGGGWHSANYTRIKLSSDGIGREAVWEDNGTTLEDVLSSGSERLFRRMEAEYVREAGSLQDIDLHLAVSEVRSLQDYVRVMNYLARMPQNVDVRVLRVSDKGVEFMLKTRGVWSDLLRVYKSAAIFEVAEFKMPELNPPIGDADATDTDASVPGQTPKNDDDNDTDEATDEATAPGEGSQSDPQVRHHRAKHFLHAVLRH